MAHLDASQGSPPSKHHSLDPKHIKFLETVPGPDLNKVFWAIWSDPTSKTERACIVKELYLKRYDKEGRSEFCDTMQRICEELSEEKTLVKVYGHMLDNGCPYVVTELAENDLQTLLDATPNDPPSQSKRLQMLLDVVDGMRALHAAGIVHADLNATHVLLFADLRAKLTSFGLFHLRRGRFLPWHVEFVAPELIQPRLERELREADHKPADVFSFGILMFVVLTWTIPFIVSQDIATYH